MNIYKEKFIIQQYKEYGENEVSFEYFKEMNQVNEKDIPSIGHFVCQFIDETLHPLVDKFNSLDIRTEKINCNENLCGVLLNNRNNLIKLYS